jgi:beta-glucanase (GH16 family)
MILAACTSNGRIMPENEEPAAPPTDLPGGWKLVWSDEFDGPAGSPPDAVKWGYDLGGAGWGNQEWEYYTDLPENAALDGAGSLVITALEVSENDRRGLDCWYGACKFTSARIQSQDRFEFTYGRVEARIQLPYGQGVWPAFWMLGSDIDQTGWPACGEIDIMENIGSEPGKVHGTVHGPGYSGEHGISSAFSLADGQHFREDFHVFTLEWTENEIRWIVDGTSYAVLDKKSFSESRPWVFDHPFFILLNLAIGGNWPGYPDSTSTFPQQMLVDYIRVYQQSNDL